MSADGILPPGVEHSDPHFNPDDRIVRCYDCDHEQPYTGPEDICENCGGITCEVEPDDDDEPDPFDAANDR